MRNRCDGGLQPRRHDTIAGFRPRQPRAAHHRPGSIGGIRRNPEGGRTRAARGHFPGTSGAVAAPLVICVGWLLGWPAVLPATSSSPPFNAAVITDLGARVASIEAKTSKPAAPAPDPAMVGRVEALEKSLASLRGDLSGLRAQSEKLTAAVNDVKSTPRESAPSVDLSAINERIAQVERATRAQVSEIAQESAKPADDVPLRRIVAASVLDVSVRQGEPYVAALAAAKSLAENADALKPLEGFAASGVPSAAGLSRELLTLVPKLSPAQENATSGSGIVDRLDRKSTRLNSSHEWNSFAV